MLYALLAFLLGLMNFFSLSILMSSATSSTGWILSLICSNVFVSCSLCPPSSQYSLVGPFAGMIMRFSIGNMILLALNQSFICMVQALAYQSGMPLRSMVRINVFFVIFYRTAGSMREDMEAMVSAIPCSLLGFSMTRFDRW